MSCLKIYLIHWYREVFWNWNICSRRISRSYNVIMLTCVQWENGNRMAGHPGNMCTIRTDLIPRVYLHRVIRWSCVGWRVTNIPLPFPAHGANSSMCRCWRHTNTNANTRCTFVMRTRTWFCVMTTSLTTSINLFIMPRNRLWFIKICTRLPSRVCK